MHHMTPWDTLKVNLLRLILLCLILLHVPVFLIKQ